jgi:hypothetical protein
MSGPTAYAPSSNSISVFSSPSSLEETQRAFRAATDHMGASASARRRLDAIDELLKPPEEVTRENWDGEGEDAIPEAAFEEARDFLRKFSLLMPLPAVNLEPDGYLGLEWYKDNRHVFVVSFNGTGSLSYSGLIGHESVYSLRYMEEEIPEEILSNIARVYL